MSILFRTRRPLEKAPRPRSTRDEALRGYLEDRLLIEIDIDTTGEVDYEDWTESMVMLAAALRAGLAVDIYPDRSLHELCIEDAVIRITGEETPNILLSGLRINEGNGLDEWNVAWPRRGVASPNDYASLWAFQDNAGREVALADMPGETSNRRRETRLSDVPDGDLLGRVCQRFAGRSILIKQVRPAKSMPLVRLDLAPDVTPDQAHEAFLDEVGLHICRFEGEANALLVQDHIEMTHETRFFVIGHTVVSGAACIESDTPLQRPATVGLLPPQFELRRGSGEVVTDYQAKDVLLAKAKRVARQVAHECPGICDYSLDLALDSDRRPLVIEMNDAANSGLYANNENALLDMIVRQARREAAYRKERWRDHWRWRA